MPHPDPKQDNASRGPLASAGRNSAASDAGSQARAQSSHGRTEPVTDGQGPNEVRSGATASEVRRDSDGAVPDTGMDRDSGAGAAGGRDTGGAQASRNARQPSERSGGRGDTR